MKKIVVIGGGTMGLDIAQTFARKGFDVVVRDISDDIIKASEARLNKSLDKLVSKGKLDEAGKAAILATVEPFVAALLGILAYHEAVTPYKLLGMAAILGAVVLLNRPERSR